MELGIEGEGELNVAVAAVGGGGSGGCGEEEIDVGFDSSSCWFSPSSMAFRVEFAFGSARDGL